MLSNKTILLTRPCGREKHLQQLIESAGGHVIHYPVIEIHTIAPNGNIHELLETCSMAIFISQSAVEHSCTYFSYFPNSISIVSIGSKTSDSLERHHMHVDLEAPDHNTESLLQMVEFQPSMIKGQKILIFRGKGGRALLGDTLKNRGAEVDYIETYARKLPSHKPLTKNQIASLDAITVSSNEGLDNLVTLMHGTEQIFEIPLVIPSERAKTLAGKYGFRIIVTAENATDEAELSALTHYFSSESIS